MGWEFRARACSAGGVNYVDVQLCRATATDSIYFRSLPATLTGDVVGTVEKAGPDADPALTGTRVAVLLEDAYADYVVADASWLVSVPERLGADAASLLPTVGAVALGVLRTGRLGHRDTILVTAGAGAIGHLAGQLARREGAGTVIATAGSVAKLAFVMELGADVSSRRSCGRSANGYVRVLPLTLWPVCRTYPSHFAARLRNRRPPSRASGWHQIQRKGAN